MKKSGIREVNSVEDFSNVYKVFGEKPYEEKYTEEDFREIYEEYKELGTIYGAYVDDRCVGLIAILRGKRNGQQEEVSHRCHRCRCTCSWNSDPEPRI